jgi:uncharacterized protein YecE (DUF72 family)
MDVKIGCCGFPKARGKYYERFKVVEVQQTFYQPPAPETAGRWRMEAPVDFEFTLKAWQLITHESKSPTYRRLSLSRLEGKLENCGSFKPTDEVRWAWGRMREVAITLKARVVVFQTPASFQPSLVNKENFKKFFHEADRGDFLLVWEPRGPWGRDEIQDLCRELNLIHGVDPFKTEPSFGEVRYFRLHGVTGYRYRFREEDLECLREKCQGICYCLFNNVSMWIDALAFLELAGEGAEVPGDSRIEGR